MTDALAKADVDYGNALAQEVRGLIDEAHRLRGAAERKRDVRAAIRGLDVALKAVELFGRASGQLSDKRSNVTVNLNISPAEGIAEAIELLLLLADRHALLRIAGQLQQRASELEPPVLESSIRAVDVQHATQAVDCARSELT